MEVLRAMEADAGLGIKELRVDGGATANDLLMQFQADVLGVRVLRPAITEVTAIGAAYLAGLAVGYWQSVDELQQQWQVKQSYEPDSRLDTAPLIQNWHRAVQTAKAWSELQTEI
jgi:glycerol kinase